MGNISAHSAPNPPMDVPLSPPIIPPKDESKGSLSKGSNNNGIQNPGTMEDLHKQCTDVFPMVFEGGKFLLNKALSNHFQVSHTVNFSTVQPPGYRFGATYLGDQVSPTEVYPILVGDIDPSGNLNANIIHQLSPNIRTKFVAQIDGGKWQATQLTTDYKGRTSTSSLTLGNIDVLNGTGLAVAHYLQQVTAKVALGSELAYQYGPQIPGGQIALHSIAARYSGSNFTATGTLGGAGLHLCYHQKCSENLQIATELETSLRMQESVATSGFQVEIPKANCTFRGKIDSNGTVGAVMEKKLTPLPFCLTLSAMHNHPKNKFKLGVGFSIG
ncbi:mitochondrial import receptor subunit TOM40 homolog 1 [Hyalella azteca]|uniref:Mitochondrial import receptor subunit TOM40 homolog 1 n=1 Tax=Hyalella azteca TaxID=294128 RepID=A0A8B7PH37_HYAAZ|nr:mitochondrial import receptor subunit TOM40 homolog 1 [Hyalella azteca]